MFILKKLVAELVGGGGGADLILEGLTTKRIIERLIVLVILFSPPSYTIPCILKHAYIKHVFIKENSGIYNFFIEVQIITGTVLHTLKYK